MFSIRKLWLLLLLVLVLWLGQVDGFPLPPRSTWSGTGTITLLLRRDPSLSISNPLLPLGALILLGLPNLVAGHIATPATLPPEKSLSQLLGLQSSEGQGLS
jgi:hypothetical protein